MWTPKRIVLLVGWIAIFVSAYAGSSYLLGSIDGLPPLPERFKPIAGEPGNHTYPAQPEFSANRKLRLAFGDNSAEVKSRKFKLEVEQRGLVLAAQDVTIEPDGRAKLKPFSVAIFGKDKGDGQYPDITIVQAPVAYLTFDKKLQNITQMGNSKIIGGEMSADAETNITIVNNRGTADPTDDVSLTSVGTLYYDEARHHVWTMEPVKILDLRSKPHPTTIDGNGADLYLASEPAKGTAPAAKNKNQAVSGVDRVELRSDVMMNLWVDSKSGLLGPPHEDPKVAKNVGTAPRPHEDPKVAKNVSTAPQKALPGAEKKPDDQENNAHVTIETQGPFAYDFKTDKAVFEISKLSGPFPNLVTVDRSDDKTKLSDQLKCDLLEIQFARKSGPATTQGAAAAADKLEIETVRATGKSVVLTSDAEVLEAHGNEFTYNSKTLESVLKGSPLMDALKEGNEIRAPELRMINIKGAQQAKAIGEGTMNFWGTEGAHKPQEARWKKQLSYSKEGDKDQLTLVGNAVFLDPEHEQELKAETLKVLLAPGEKGPNQGAGDAQKKPNPTQVEAIGTVRATSPDLNIEDAERLILLFKDVPPGVLPPPNPAAAKAPADGKPAAPADGKPAAPAAANGKPAEPAAGPTKPEPPKQPRPINLRARFVQAQILREGKRNELQEVWCQGTVRVLQAPEKPGDNGVDIRGDTLNLTHRPEGDILTVMGNGKPAQVQMDQLFILGPEINMDQTRNDVEVKGMGIMRMLSKQGFDGKALDKPSELKVEWEKRMFFDGTQASFFGAVKAAQDTGLMNCEELQVTLDRHVSLKEGAKGEQPAVEKLVCHNQVALQDTKYDGAKVVESKRIFAPELAIDNDKDSKERCVRASGHGMVRIYQLSAKEEGMDSPKKKPEVKGAQPKSPAKAAPAEDKEFKLTIIWYDGRMFANNLLGIAKFYDNVYVVQVPTENPDLKIGNGAPPPGSMAMKCDRLEVRELKHPDGSTSQEMRAYDKVYVEGQTYSANCDVLKYDTSKEQIILEATIPGTYAVLYKEKYRGGDRDTVEAKKITYNRLTGEYTAHEARGSRISP